MFAQTAEALTATATVPTKSSLAVRAVNAVGRWLCGKRGHHSTLSFDQGRMFLRCTHCGHETPGWHCK